MPPSAPSHSNPNGHTDTTIHFDTETNTSNNNGGEFSAKLDPMPPSTQLHSQVSPYGNLMSPYGQGYAGGGLYSTPFSMGAYGANNFYSGAAGMYGGFGGYGSGMAAGSLSNLNQFLFGVQNVIFSLTQAVQIIGMNTEAVQKLMESGVAMFDHAMATWHEMKALEDASRALESNEDRKRRRRLRALRWALTAAATYAAFSLLRYMLSRKRNHRRLRMQQPYPST